ncbi:MAG TPA: hypothetical protein VKU01_28745 [Bryobacteraceae bacterium]|nr:hypothetical protein [Bryobacteraceae bacterium]
MRKFCSVLLMVAAAPAVTLAASNSLLNLLMPDAKVIAGVEVRQAKGSPFGTYVLSHMQPSDKAYTDFVTQTGFDPTRDVDQILMAANGAQTGPMHWLVVARGRFNGSKAENAAAANGGVVTAYQGVGIITQKVDDDATFTGTAVAILDSNTAAMGDLANVKAAIDRAKSASAAAPALAAKIAQVRGSNDFWFTTLVPLSEFAGAMPNSGVSSAMRGNVVTAIQQASGGLKFGSTVQLFAEALTRSEKDAQALVDVVKFLASMIQTNRDKDTTSAQVSTLLDNLKTNTNGSTMTMNLAIPESTLENMLTASHQPRRAKQQQN